jgi:hypothetical protein
VPLADPLTTNICFGQDGKTAYATLLGHRSAGGVRLAPPGRQARLQRLRGAAGRKRSHCPARITRSLLMLRIGNAVHDGAQRRTPNGGIDGSAGGIP